MRAWHWFFGGACTQPASGDSSASATLRATLCFLQPIKRIPGCLPEDLVLRRGAVRAGEEAKAAYLRSRLRVGRPEPGAMRESLPVLCGELQRCFGELGYLPSRADLRAAGRYPPPHPTPPHDGSISLANERSISHYICWCPPSPLPIHSSACVTNYRSHMSLTAAHVAEAAVPSRGFPGHHR